MKKRKKRNPTKFTDKLVEVIISRRKVIEKGFFIIIILSVICTFMVGVNYDLTKYLPEWAPSKLGIDVMEREFGYPGSARVMIGDVSIHEAKLYKEQIKRIDSRYSYMGGLGGPNLCIRRFSCSSEAGRLLQGWIRRHGHPIHQRRFRSTYI